MLCAAIPASCAGWQAPACRIPPAPGSAWEQQEPPIRLRFEKDRVFVDEKDKPARFVGVEGRGPSQLAVRTMGDREIWSLGCKNHRLAIQSRSLSGSFERVPRPKSLPASEPLRLPPPRDLGPERVRTIQEQIAQWLAADQAIRKKSGVTAAEIRSTDHDVLSGFLRLLQEVGWIDARRFGAKTSYGAAILAKHSAYLPLLRVALPIVERDFAHSGDDAQAFAIFFDQTRLSLGLKQRYGTQLGEDPHGEPYVVALEDPQRVDALRQAIGLPPLASYLLDASAVLFDGKSIRMAREDE